MGSQSFVGQLGSAASSRSISEYVLLAIGGLFAYWVTVVIYRLTLHPLAKYPGNFLDKISTWPHVYRVMVGTRHIRQHEAHKKYGHIVRIGPNWLDFDTDSAQATIHRNRLTNVGKGEWYKTEPAMSGEMSVQTTIDKKQHDFRRRVMAPAFSETALRNHEVFIDGRVREFFDLMAGKEAKKDADGWTEPRDFDKWCRYLSFDYIADLTYGSSLDMLRSEENRFVVKMLYDTTFFINYAAALPCGWFVRWLMSSKTLQSLDPSAAEGQKFVDLSEAKLLARQKLEEEETKEPRKDIFHYIINSKDPETGKGFTQRELIADSLLLLAAGSDALAITFSAALFYLLRNPETLAKLTNEVRTAFPTENDITGPKLAQLPYLNGVMWESLRICPAVPSSLPREVLPGGLDVDGVHLPAGTLVGVSPYQVHHNEEIFPDSFAFKPERWIEDGSTDISKLKRALCTFSAGRFDCIGRNVAYLSMRISLARMVWAYDVRAAGSDKVSGGGGDDLEPGRQRKDEYQITDFAMAYVHKTGPIVQFKARDAKA